MRTQVLATSNPIGQGDSLSLVLFDLDGVLIDSLGVMEIAWEEVRSRLGVRASFDEYVNEIGRPFPDIMDRLGLAEDQSRIKGIYDAAAKRECEQIKSFPGIGGMLADLRAAGLMVGVVTSKCREAAVRIVERCRLEPECLMTPDDGCGKPSPQLLWQAVARLGASLHETVYVGDMEVDRTAAARAGIHFVHATWGYGEVTEDSAKATSPWQLAIRLTREVGTRHIEQS